MKFSTWKSLRPLSLQGNVAANEEGVAVGDLKVNNIALGSIVGREVVVHENRDDCVSQPIGKRSYNAVREA